MAWIQQWRLQRILDAPDGEQRLAEHARRCPRDREAAQRLLAMSQQLKADAPAWRDRMVPSQRRIVSHIPRRRRAHAVGIALAAAAAVVLGLLVVIPGDPPPPQKPTITLRAPDPTLLFEPANLIADPLTQEARKLSDDVRKIAASALGPLLAFNREPTPQDSP